MLQDLDATIRAMLADPDVPPSMDGVSITFRAPDKGFGFDGPTVNLFLYGMRENRVLRDPVPIVERVGATFVRRTPPLRLDCDYLVTAWSKRTGDAAVEEEHRLLGLALAKIVRFPLVPPAYLRGSLADQPYPLQVWPAQEDDGRSLGEFWSALGVAPRPAFHLSVTVTVDPQETQPEGPPVATSRVTLDDDLTPATTGESRYTIGGTVRLAGGGAPVPGVTVTIDAARSARTDTAGRYVLSHVGAGSHVLRATAPGHSPAERTITVPAPLGAYDLELQN
ncbi:Pvc16 family protein [Nonomuraea sp. NPDC002799]